MGASSLYRGSLKSASCPLVQWKPHFFTLQIGSLSSSFVEEVENLCHRQPLGHTKLFYKDYQDSPEAQQSLAQIIQEQGFSHYVLPLQTHSNKLEKLDKAKPLHNSHLSISADALLTQNPSLALVIQTADCLPIFLFDPQSHIKALIHAGWRGLSSGIIENTLTEMQPSKQSLCYIGDSIQAADFEVGYEVYQAFCQRNPRFRQAFSPSRRNQHYLCNLQAIAADILKKHGVYKFSASGLSTFREPHLASYRRLQHGGQKNLRNFHIL